MKFYDFETSTQGKWILAGEHAVLRGYAALVFPIKEKKLSLRYLATPSSLRLSCEGALCESLEPFFWRVLEQGLKLLNIPQTSIHGHFYLKSNIPLGVGMGASAALCVALSRWFNEQSFCLSEPVFSFAKRMEDFFHGQSSGVDIVGVSEASGSYFRQGKWQPLVQNLKPHWYLSACGEPGITRDCIRQTKLLWQENLSLAIGVDKKMHTAVKKASAALKRADSSAMVDLASAINDSAACFDSWGLISEALALHMQTLRKAGALAVKPTGSGGGGYVLSLWEKPIKTMELAGIEFIPV